MPGIRTRVQLSSFEQRLWTRFDIAEVGNDFKLEGLEYRKLSNDWLIGHIARVVLSDPRKGTSAPRYGALSALMISGHKAFKPEKPTPSIKEQYAERGWRPVSPEKLRKAAAKKAEQLGGD